MRLVIRVFLSSAVIAVVAHATAAETRDSRRRNQLPPQVTRVDDVLAPVASEVFKTLDHYAHYNWRNVQRDELATWRARGDQTSIALLLGAVIAEGFIAVEAKDAPQVEKLGRAVLTLSRALGVQRWAIKRSRSIVDHAESGDWTAVREEWNHVLPDVQQGMNALRSEALAHVVSLGGWARGAEALATLIGQKYSAEEAELLRQPAMLAHFESQISEMTRERRGGSAFARTSEHLQDFQRIIESAGAQISPAAAKEIAAVAAALIKSATREQRSR